MKIDQNYTCPECDLFIDLTITLGDPMFFSPSDCPSCNHEIMQEEIEPNTEIEEERLKYNY